MRVNNDSLRPSFAGLALDSSKLKIATFSESEILKLLQDDGSKSIFDLSLVIRLSILNFIGFTFSDVTGEKLVDGPEHDQ